MGSPSNIDRLARCWGLVPRYTDALGRRRSSKRESLLAILRAVGAPVERASDVDAALRDHHRTERSSLAPPVHVLWEGGSHEIRLNCTPAERRGTLRLTLQFEGGAIVRGRYRVARGGSVPLPGRWEAGYHTLTIDSGSRSGTVHIIAAPRRCHDDGRRSWALFLPLHALHRSASPKVASYSDLGDLLDWSSSLGATHLGTLPLLPIQLERPVDPSPYRPLSRRLWSELYVDPRALPSPSGRRSDQRQTTIRATHLDHAAEWERLEPLLSRAAARLLSSSGQPRNKFRSFLRQAPHIREYARFRAAWKAQQRPWTQWPRRMREGRLRASDGDQRTEQTYLYAQWAAATQMGEFKSRKDGASLYLDLPLGTHPHGFDCYQHKDLFAHDASVGAPPDALMSLGQCWAFPPLRPRQSRETGHRYFAECLRHAMSAAGMLRIDHVMSLHRCFWIPQGADASEGVYVRYPFEELYAVICLESQRARCKVVGEDIGTVPRELRPALRRHGLMRTSVLQSGKARKPLPGVAALQTHDMPPFADWWGGSDIDRRLKLGLLTDAAARRERRTRASMRKAWLRDLEIEDSAGLLPALLTRMNESEARCVIVDLEDLWGERRPQNIPGTVDAWPNWRRRTRLPFERFRQNRRLLARLRRLSTRERRES